LKKDVLSPSEAKSFDRVFARRPLPDPGIPDIKINDIYFPLFNFAANFSLVDLILIASDFSCKS